MKTKIVTIGVYGFEEDSFFQALRDAHVSLFCDIRLRRGMRGSKYAFVNSEQLQQKLEALGVRYLHVKALAPSQVMREKQHREDEKSGILKRERAELGQDFVDAYEEYLSNFNFNAFMQQIQVEKVVCLFCVEREANACHRSLVVKFMQRTFSFNVEHIS